MPDLGKMVGQHMYQEAPYELTGSQAHLLLLVAIPVVTPLEGDHSVFKFQNAIIGDGHPVGIASEVFDHFTGVFERRLAVDDPFLLIQR